MRLEKRTDGPVLSQSLFSTAHVPTSSLRSHVTSGVMHALLVLALLLITFPVMREEVRKQHLDSVTLITPRVTESQFKAIRSPHIPAPVTVTRNVISPKPVKVLTPPKINPIQVPKPQIMAAAPEIINVAPAVTPEALPEAKIAPAPKPPVRTGSFETADAAKAPQTPKVTKVGGFGDPNGVNPSATSNPASLTMAKVGSFDLPAGGGEAGGGGHNASGGVRQTSFGSAGAAERDTASHKPGKVETGAFGESAIAAAQLRPSPPQPAPPVFTPVEILSKPKPVYTEEARSLKLEGQVSLEVVFLSTGSVRILRVIHGLGHGLDEAAETAALHVRFKPATRAGVPVDANATIHITFELT